MNELDYAKLEIVAPHAGAWIETWLRQWSRFRHSGSLPTRERGLKLGIAPTVDIVPKSLPTRERGLKPVVILFGDNSKEVAPHAGAWIETRLVRNMMILLERRSPRGSVD